MTDASALDWIDRLPQRAAQYSIIFVHAGRALRSAEEELLDVPAHHLEASSFAATELSPGADLVVVHGVESLAADRGQRLGSFREWISREATAGRAFVLLSKIAKTAYPETTGSDVIADAKQIFAPRLSWTADEAKAEVLVECVAELGDRTADALAESIWELQLGPSDTLRNLGKSHVEALRGAGLVHSEASEVRWVEGVSFKQLRVAAATVTSEAARARVAVPDTFSDLWVLERTVRNLVRRGLVEKQGIGWRETCLGEQLKADVVDRARAASHPLASGPRDLRDPLEWLTTTELLDLRERHELGELGLAPALWRKLRAEVVPIRNKVAHMRMITADDARMAGMWRKVLEKADGGL